MIGVGWDQLLSPVYPANFNVGLVLRFVFEPNEQDAFAVQIRILSVDTGVDVAGPIAAETSPPPRPATWQPGDSILATHLAVGLGGLPLPSPGHYRMSLVVAGEELASVPFLALVGTAPSVAIK